MTDPTETARALLYRHGLPEDVIDGALCLHAQELAAEQAGPDDRPLSPFYSHEKCGFHWHGRDDMDIPLRDGEPVCPRCELAALSTDITVPSDAAMTDLLAGLPGAAGMAAAAQAVAEAEQPETDSQTVRCPSCDHEARFHDVGGRCWLAVGYGLPGRDLVCACLVAPSAPTEEAQA